MYDRIGYSWCVWLTMYSKNHVLKSCWNFHFGLNICWWWNFVEENTPTCNIKHHVQQSLLICGQLSWQWHVKREFTNCLGNICVNSVDSTSTIPNPAFWGLLTICIIIIWWLELKEIIIQSLVVVLVMVMLLELLEKPEKSQKMEVVRSKRDIHFNLKQKNTRFVTYELDQK